MTLPLTPTTGTVLNMTPANGLVHFTAPGGETWTRPLLGYAVVVTYFDARVMEYEANLQPVVLSQGCHPIPLAEYLEGEAPDGTRVEVAP